MYRWILVKKYTVIIPTFSGTPPRLNIYESFTPSPSKVNTACLLLWVCVREVHSLDLPTRTWIPILAAPAKLQFSEPSFTFGGQKSMMVVTFLY